MKIKSKILSNFFNENYGLKLGELNNTIGSERVNELFFLIFPLEFTGARLSRTSFPLFCNH